MTDAAADDDGNGSEDRTVYGQMPPEFKEVLDTMLTGKHAYTQGFWEDVQAFVHAVDWWQDRWIWGLIGFEVFMLLLILLNRKCWERLTVLFLVIAALLGGAERMNTAARENWKSFSSQDYFDESGGFMMALYGMPLLLCQLLIVIFLLKEAVSTLVTVKRMELKQKKTKETKKDK
eukprot:TRINITY_DN40391_c0_g1_i1.p1 TRINITY_DN40391_c0_g1~~TRINITY_DN40391_c0_g1_i1.p1  ORF type:complete len:176 (+),score=48.25 TRINITY_DN40391_c0_g1_i1:121-648(+)